MAEIVSTLKGVWSELSVGLVLLLIIVGGYYEVWVWGTEIRRCRRELEMWKAMALKSNYAVEMSTHATQVLSEKVTSMLPSKEEDK